MIRLLFDDYGDAHKDIILKVDAMPSFALFADSYFLADFLGGKQVTRTEIVLDYLQYFREAVQQLTEQETFIVFDLSDAYIGGFFMSGGKKGLVKIQYGTSTEIQGHSTSLHTINAEVKALRSHFREERSWLLSAAGILEGLDWSSRRIQAGGSEL